MARHSRSGLNDLIFSVTYRCNLRCQTCYYAGAMDAAVAAEEKELTLEEIEKVSLSIGDFNGLLISGGEPFLRKDLAEICEIFCGQNNVHSIHLPTNGILTDTVYSKTGEILRKCPGVQLLVGLPLDGLQETHDAIKGVRGSFDQVVKTAGRLAGLKKDFNNLKVYIISTVTRGNLGEMIKLSEFIRNALPVDSHGPSPARGTPYDRRVSPPSAEEWDRLSMALMPYHEYWNSKTGDSKWRAFLNTNRTRYLYKMYTRVLQGRRLPFRCGAGEAIGVLEPNGDVKLCELTETIANVRSFDYNFFKAWFCEAAAEKRSKVKACSCAHACFLWPGIRSSFPAWVMSSFCVK
jgi:MoaA/NifB/PqqE/SkfB family radical SAM enzyme